MRRNYLTKYLRLLRIVVVAFVLVMGLLLPAMAQPNKFAPVDVDGVELFRISNTEQTSAAQRAEWINTQLREIINSGKDAKINVDKRSNEGKTYTIITLNDDQLLTITENDVENGNTVPEQAIIWKDKIQNAIATAQTERSDEFIRQQTLLSIAILVMAIALNWVIGILWRELRGRIAPVVIAHDSSDQNQQQGTLNLLLKATLFLTRAALWIGVTLYITNLFPFTRQWSYNITNSIITSLTAPIFKDYTITTILILIGLFLGLIIVAGAVTNVLRSRVLRVLRVSVGAQELIAIIFKYTLIAIGSVVLLQIWGIDLSSLAILASALGVGIGFGFQDIAKNFGSGLVLLFERPIKIGDFVEVGEYMGIVEQIGPRSVVIRTLDRVSIIVPNSRFLENEVINWSHHNPISRIHLPVGVAYHSDIHKVKSSLLEAAENYPDVLPNPQPQVFFKGFGDSSLNFELLVWISKPAKQVLISSDLYYRIEALLRKNEVEIPFPQRDLNVRNGHLPVKLSPEVEEALLKSSHSNGRANNKSPRDY